jgi:hypothetical protein
VKIRHLADEFVSLPQAVEVTQGVERRRTIGRMINRMFISDHHCPRLALESATQGLNGELKAEIAFGSYETQN